jgi:hypothetical protein
MSIPGESFPGRQTRSKGGNPQFMADPFTAHSLSFGSMKVMERLSYTLTRPLLTVSGHTFPNSLRVPRFSTHPSEALLLMP